MHTEIDGEQSLSSTYCLEQGTRDTCSPHCLKQSTHISLFLFGSHFFCLKQSTHDTCSPRCPSRRGSTRRGPSGRRRSLRSGLRKGCSATTRPQPHARVRRDVPQEPEEKYDGPLHEQLRKTKVPTCRFWFFHVISILVQGPGRRRPKRVRRRGRRRRDACRHDGVTSRVVLREG